MEKIDKKIEEINGAEAVVIHDGNIVLGLQQNKRWYELENGEKVAIIKTLGGKIEKKDKNSSRNAVIRELFEEVKGIEENDIKVNKKIIFTKKIKISELNPFEKENNLKMNADFYLIEICNKKKIQPNDLPGLLEVPIEIFLKLEFAKQSKLNNLQKYIIRSKNCNLELPENYVLFIPEEVKNFLKMMRGKIC